MGLTFVKNVWVGVKMDADEMEMEMEHGLDNYLTWYYEERD